MTKKAAAILAGLIIGFLAMVGLQAFVAEWCYQCAISEEQRVRRIVAKMIREARLEREK
jgi:hypothetical protein